MSLSRLVLEEFSTVVAVSHSFVESHQSYREYTQVDKILRHLPSTAPMILSQSELHRMLSSSSPAIDDFPPSAVLITPMLQMLHVLGAVLYAQRSGTVCIRPTVLPKVSPESRKPPS